MFTKICFIVVTLCLTGVHSYLTTKPTSTHYTLGRSSFKNITLKCNANTTIQWLFKLNEEKYRCIYRYNAIQDDFGTTYEVKPDSTALIIKNISKAVAGEYKCVDDGSGESASAGVMIFDGEPVCMADIEENQAELCFNLSYWGNVVPRVRLLQIFTIKSKEIKMGITDKSTINNLHFCAIVNRTDNYDYNHSYYFEITLPDTKVWKYSYFEMCEFQDVFPPLITNAKHTVNAFTWHSKSKTTQRLNHQSVINNIIDWWGLVVGISIICFIIVTTTLLIYYRRCIVRSLCPDDEAMKESIPMIL